MDEDNKTNIEDSAVETNIEEGIDNLEQLKKSYEEELNKLQDSYTRLLAELVNTKKNLDIEKDKSKQSLILKVINIVETYSLLSNEEGSSEALNNILQELNTLLITESVNKIELKIGDKFDSNISEVISTQSGEEDGKLVAVISPAWKYKDRIIKTAKVVVSKNSI